MDAESLNRREPLPKPSKLTFVTRVQQFEHRKKELEYERDYMLQTWREISDHIQTRRGRYLREERQTKRKSGNVLNEKPIFASRNLGAGMSGGVASPARPWVKITTPDSDLNERHDAKLWLDETQRRLYKVLAGSNYYGMRATSFRDMGDFGQGPLLLDFDYEDIIRGYVSPPGEYFLARNDRGVADVMYREFQMTVAQLIQKFKGNVPREVKERYDRGDYEHDYEITHVIEPNVRQVRDALGPRGMPYLNIYYCNGVQDLDSNAVMLATGYHELPFSAAPWEIQSGDTYADGCGSLVLPACKSLQALEKRRGQIVDKLANNSVQAPEGLRRNTINHQPGEVTYYPDKYAGNSANAAPIQPLYRIDPVSLTVIGQEGQILENRIDRGYYVDLFFMLANSDKNQPITAREVQERHEEKLVGLGPVLDNTHSQGLDIEINRIINVMARAGILPEVPQSMEGIALKAEYTSILAVAQRSLGVSQLERFVGFIGNLSAGNPAIFDKWDMDQTVDEYGNALGVPAAVVRSDDQVVDLRKQRAEKEEQVEQMAQVEQSAQTAQVLSQADTSRDSNLLADILGGSQGRV